jgi:peptidoglycan/xylan/chitin deacetylase (PgdA/CDA1 family)
MMSAMYRTILGGIGAAARLTGFFQPTIFCFHSVRPAAAAFRSQLSVDEAFLEGLVLSLRKLSIPILPIAEAVERVRRADLRPFVVLTFDDGYIDNYTTLYPLMARWEVPFTIFVTTGLVDDTVGMWWDVLERLAEGGAFSTPPEDRRKTTDDLAARFKAATRGDRRALLADLIRQHPRIDAGPTGRGTLSWQMLGEMQASGLLTVGGHTISHPMLAHLDPGEIETELAGSRTRLEEMLDAPVRFMAYPFGQDWEIGPHAAQAAARAGYEAAFTTEARSLCAGDADRAFLLPRVLLSSKAVHPDIALAYLSGVPARLNRMAGRR